MYIMKQRLYYKSFIKEMSLVLEKYVRISSESTHNKYGQNNDCPK
jgi:hypothetical protein